jgi:hypothetical protein
MFDTLIGNTKPPLATPAELNCKRCGRFGCRCSEPSAIPARDICPACRRDRLQKPCICASEMPASNMRATEAEAAEALTPFLTGRARVEAIVKEVRYCWHDSRDPARVERIVRELAEKVYLA